MPLLDHFHPLLLGRRHWESFHSRWAAAIADALNGGLLPRDYFAEMQVHVGSRIEVDVATFEEERPAVRRLYPEGATATATLAAPVWAPPAPDLVLPGVFPDEIEVLVYQSEGGPNLVAAIELVSPGNKDRAEARRAFAAKCDAYLQRRIGLAVVDIASSREGNLHDELIRLHGHPQSLLFPSSPSIYAVAYGPFRLAGTEGIEVWTSALKVGDSLPTLPLALRDAACLPLDLEATYTEARQRSRLPG